MNTFKPLVSIVLPVYNHASLLLQAVDSILGQEYQPLELVIVNDGSTDNTGQVLERYRAEPGVKIISQENQGIAGALNTGFKETSGSLLSWTSADNRYRRDALGRMVSHLQGNPDTDLVYANVALIDASGKALRGSSYRALDQDPADTSILRLPRATAALAASNDNFINACFLYRRSLAQRVGAYRSDLLGFEDYDFWMRCLLCGTIAHIEEDEPLYEYRLHPNSLTARLDSDELSQKQTAFASRTCSAQKELRHLRPAQLSSGLEPLLRTMQAASLEKARWGKATSKQAISFPHSDSEPLMVDILETFSPEGYSLPSQLVDTQLHLLSLQTDSSLNTGPWLTFSPGLPSTLFERARESNFQAVEKEAETVRTRLLVLPTLPADTPIEPALLNLLANKEYTTVLLAFTKAQREHADALYLASGNSSLLRIIDLQQASRALCSAKGEMHSLLYVLSSVDEVHLYHPLAKLSCGLHLCAQLSARAGRMLQLHSVEESTAQHSDQSLRHYIEESPHITFGQHRKSASTAQLDHWLKRYCPSVFQQRLQGMSIAQFEFSVQSAAQAASRKG